MELKINGVESIGQILTGDGAKFLTARFLPKVDLVDLNSMEFDWGTNFSFLMAGVSFPPGVEEICPFRNFSTRVFI